jgi:hypothetical protein
VFEAGWLRFALRWLSYTVGMALGVRPWSSLAVLAPPR